MINRFRITHKTVGILLALFIVFMSVSGVLLNHSTDLGLDQSYVPGNIASHYYTNNPSAMGLIIDDTEVYSFAGKVYFGSNEVTSCHSGLSGAVSVEEEIILLCENELLLFTPDGQLVERLGEAHGVPSSVAKIAAADGQLYLLGKDQVFSFDPANLDLHQATYPGEWSSLESMPVDVLLADSVSWQQFILDLHSGRFFGSAGVWLGDLISLLLIGMVITGLVMWNQPRRDTGCASVSAQSRELE